MTIQIVRFVKNCFNLELDCRNAGSINKSSLTYKQRVITDLPFYYYLSLNLEQRNLKIK